jgi:hypothetical protein
MDVNEHERLFNFILRHTLKYSAFNVDYCCSIFHSYVIVFRPKNNICVFRVSSLKKIG